MTKRKLFGAALTLGVFTVVLAPGVNADGSSNGLNGQLARVLRQHRFTGRIAETLEPRLGRRVDKRLAETGRMLWFDTLTGLNDDNSCSGCHSPTTGFGDTQSIAIGIENNRLVGSGRFGPRNQRRTPMAINTAFFPALMWNARFSALSGDPFKNRPGFAFPAPEGLSLSYLPNLLTAQAFIPPTERNEVAGFHFPGGNNDIRGEVLKRLNATPAYRRLFSESFSQVRQGGPIDFDMFGRAIAEFEFTMIYADAPLDRFARGEEDALTRDQKQGALLFFGKAGCVKCHAVAGGSNEMFSDFQNHVAGVPQISPAVTNSVFDGPNADEDFGMEQVTGNPDDRYKFRTSPLRNLKLQPAFFHNGAFVDLGSAIRYHLNASGEAARYSPASLAPDLQGPTGPITPVIARLDPLLAQPGALSEAEIRQLTAFVGDGLTDTRASASRLRKLIPRSVPSGRPIATFQ